MSSFVFGVCHLHLLFSPLNSLLKLVCYSEFRGFLGMSYSNRVRQCEESNFMSSASPSAGRHFGLVIAYLLNPNSTTKLIAYLTADTPASGST